MGRYGQNFNPCNKTNLFYRVGRTYSDQREGMGTDTQEKHWTYWWRNVELAELSGISTSIILICMPTLNACSRLS